MTPRVARRSPWAAAAIVALFAACAGPTVPTPSAAPVQTSTPALATSTPGATVSPSPSPTASPTQTAPPTASPQPTVTATPGPSPTPATGITLDEALIGRHLDALAQIARDNNGERAAGTSGYAASVDYVVEQLTTLGFEVERQPFEFTFFDEVAPVSVAIDGESWTGPDWLRTNLYSGEGDISAVPVSVRGSGCDASDWNAFPSGSIALVDGDGCFTRIKVFLAQDAGAAALISLVTEWDEGEVLQPTLLEPTDIEIPAVVAGNEPSQALSDAARDGMTIELDVDVEMSRMTINNVIAEWPGATDQTVMLGGHLDSVLGGPGLNDNGSGVATLLAIAASVANLPVPERTIRLGFWGAEEFGVYGSDHYVKSLSASEESRIQAYLNLDMVASPNAGLYVYEDDSSPTGSARITRLLFDALQEMGTSGIGIPSGGSDHVAFWNADIAFGGVFSGIALLTAEEAEMFDGEAHEPADPCYHLPCDGRQNVDLDTAMILGGAIAAVLEELAY